MSQELSGGQLGLQQMGTLHEMTKPPTPTKPQMVKGKDFYWRVNDDGTTAKTEIPVGTTTAYPPGYGASVTKTPHKIWDTEGKADVVMATPDEWNRMSPEYRKAGYTVGEAPGQIRENEGLAIKAMTTAFSSDAADDQKENAVTVYNKTAPGKSTEMLEWHAGPLTWDRVRKISLPVIKKRQVTATHIRKVMKNFPGISIREAIKKLEAANK